MSQSHVTTDGRNVLLQLLKDEMDSAVANPGRYYIALSGADSSRDGLFDQMVARNEMHFVKPISNSSFVVPTFNWTSGQVYNAYDDNNPDQEKFYVANSLNEVFLVVQTGKNSAGVAQGSTVEPLVSSAVAFQSKRKSFATSDGYVWRFLYTMSGSKINFFKTNEFMPVQTIKTATTSEQVEQKGLQDNATHGEIIGIAIDSGGTGYSFTPRVDITGNGDSASFTATISDGKIVKVEVDSDGFNRILHGHSYDFAKVVPSAGDAVLRPIISPKRGVNFDPVSTLRSDQLMVQTTVQDTENVTIPLADPENDFKQVMLLRNILVHGQNDSDDAKLFSKSNGNAMNYFTVSGGSGSFVADEIFETSAQVRGKTFWHDTSNNLVYYVQNDSTGFGTFRPSDTITSTQGTGTSKLIDAINNPDVNRYSGDVLYINNLETSIQRTATQTEDFRIVLDLGTK